ACWVFSTPTMIRKTLLALNLAMLTASCSTIPEQDLASLLASQGITSPWYVRHKWLKNDWYVETWDQLAQIGPQICLSHDRYFAVRETSAGYNIEPGSTGAQQISLRDCDRVSATREFVSVYSSRDVPANRLREVIEKALSLSRADRPQENGSSIRFE